MFPSHLQVNICLAALGSELRHLPKIPAILLIVAHDQHHRRKPSHIHVPSKPSKRFAVVFAWRATAVTWMRMPFTNVPQHSSCDPFDFAYTLGQPLTTP